MIDLFALFHVASLQLLEFLLLFFLLLARKLDVYKLIIYIHLGYYKRKKFFFLYNRVQNTDKTYKLDKKLTVIFGSICVFESAEVELGCKIDEF